MDTIREKVAAFVGCSVEMLDNLLMSPDTCPLCVEVGADNHEPELCYAVLEVHWDRWEATRW